MTTPHLNTVKEIVVPKMIFDTSIWQWRIYTDADKKWTEAVVNAVRKEL